MYVYASQIFVDPDKTLKKQLTETTHEGQLPGEVRCIGWSCRALLHHRTITCLVAAIIEGYRF